MQVKKLYVFCQARARLLLTQTKAVEQQWRDPGASPAAAGAPGSAQLPSASTQLPSALCQAAWAPMGAQLLKLLKAVAAQVKQQGGQNQNRMTCGEGHAQGTGKQQEQASVVGSGLYLQGLGGQQGAGEAVAQVGQLSLSAPPPHSAAPLSNGSHVKFAADYGAGARPGNEQPAGEQGVREQGKGGGSASALLQQVGAMRRSLQKPYKRCCSMQSS